MSEEVSGNAEFGMIGLGVMGENLALNVSDHGFRVAAWNREPETLERFLGRFSEGRSLSGTASLEAFAQSLARPRRIMMMIKAGEPVDQMIERLRPLLAEGDVVIDGGNSWFKDTQRREAALAADGIRFFGCGVSGGEEGARFGPSLMPGGRRDGYETMKPVFEAIAAKTDSGPCVTYVGPGGAGHFVKMVHNGIEYGDMQLIAESYELLRLLGGLEAAELADVFDGWNRGPLESFLIEITAGIFRARDERTGGPLVDQVLDKAGQKGTGKWTAQVALDLGISVPTIAAAIDARVLSSMKSERVIASRVFPRTGISRVDRMQLIGEVHDALYASKICSYAQGMSLIRAASDEYGWGIDLTEMARIWKGGCIIRARFLDDIMRAFEANRALQNLLIDDRFAERIRSSETAWRRVVSRAVEAGVAVPAMSASLAYFDSYRSERLPQNLTQAQRDRFGAHTYQRVDDPEGAFIHSDWK